MCGTAAVLAEKPGIFHKLPGPLKILSDDDPAEMVFIVAILSATTAMNVLLTHTEPSFSTLL